VLIGYQSLEITATIIESSEGEPQQASAEPASESESAPAAVAAPELLVTDSGRQQRVAIDSWRNARQHGDRWLDGVDPQPVTIDRSSNDPLPASLRPRVSPETTEPKLRSAKAEAPLAAEESSLQPSTPDETTSRDSQLQRSAEANRRRLADWRLSDDDTSAPEPELTARPLAARTALHADLESITRRRLQMIEALATFSAEGAADLSLQPQRRVDARTLELLTSVPTVKVALGMQGAKSNVPGAGVPRTVAEALGQIVWLLSQSPLHRELRIKDLEWSFMPAVLAEQFRIFRFGPLPGLEGVDLSALAPAGLDQTALEQLPLGVAIWGKLSEAAEARLERAERLSREDWKSGDRVWLVELISPFATPQNKLAEAMLLDLMQGPFKDVAFHLHRTDPATGRRDKIRMAGHLQARATR
jgi:cytolysin-activating lysine-acyltransferase